MLEREPQSPAGMQALLTAGAWLNMIASRRSRTVFRVARHIVPYYRLLYANGLVQSGMLGALGRDGGSFDALASQFCPAGSGAGRDALEAWLGLGIALGELSRRGGRYRLKGSLSKGLAQAGADAARGLVESLSGVHHNFLTSGIRRLRGGEWLSLQDHDAPVIARSSKTVEPILRSLLERTIVKAGPVRLLEVCCGSASYLRYAASLNSSLTGLGIELDRGVSEAAREDIRRSGLDGRLQAVTGDIRQITPTADYDVALAFNCLYYFPLSGRAPFLTQLRQFLRPGGRLLLTTWLKGGGISGEGINFWFAMIEGCGRLPGKEEMPGLLEQAGFRKIQSWPLLPGENYRAYSAIA